MSRIFQKKFLLKYRETGLGRALVILFPTMPALHILRVILTKSPRNQLEFFVAEIFLMEVGWSEMMM